MSTGAGEAPLHIIWVYPGGKTTPTMMRIESIPPGWRVIRMPKAETGDIETVLAPGACAYLFSASQPLSSKAMYLKQAAGLR